MVELILYRQKEAYESRLGLVSSERCIRNSQRAQGGGNELALPVSTQDVRDVTVQLVRSSIELWQKYSSKSKVDLAAVSYTSLTLPTKRIT